MITKILTDFIVQPANVFQFLHTMGMDLLSGAGYILFSGAFIQASVRLVTEGDMLKCAVDEGAAAEELQKRIEPLVTMVACAMFVAGIFLAYVVELMPWLYFTMAILGWFVCVIEAIFEGVVMPLLVADPMGQHAFLGKAEVAIVLLLSLFFNTGTYHYWPYLFYIAIVCSASTSRSNLWECYGE